MIVAVRAITTSSAINNIVAVSAQQNHTVGLNNDGTVVAVEDNIFCQFNVSEWTNIKLPQTYSRQNQRDCLRFS